VIRDFDIVRARVYAVAPKATPSYRWTGQDGFVRVTDNILRLTAANGLEGWSSNTSNKPEKAEDGSVAEPDRSLADRLHHLAPQVLGASALEREAVSERLMRRSNDPRKRSESLIDIALWDLAARAADEPLWRFLGGYRGEIPVYASTPVFETVEDYISFVGTLVERGYGAAKLHTRCDPDWDLTMIEAVHAALGGRMRFMLDVEQRYDLRAAVRVGRHLAELGFVWFEAPLPDGDLAAYRELRRAVDVPLIPAGNTLTTLGELRTGIETGAWDHVRTGPTHNGGIGATVRAMSLADAHGMTVELQSYGYEGRKLAALHLALGLGNCGWFEQPVPETDYQYELAAPPNMDQDGIIRPPEGPGLGAVPEWDRIEDEAFLAFDVED
jgi:L-alanine-DL-glutamate epimerase-like enolase superfamily enzyme